MNKESSYSSDILKILSKRQDQGADFWATSDRKIMKGSPFTTLDCASMLFELGMAPEDPILKDTAELVFSTWREDGRFKVAPTGGIYPCHTINVLRTLCLLGYGTDPRLQKTFQYLLDEQHSDGGWRCKKFSFGHGPETEASNPGPTLTALDAFRYSEAYFENDQLDLAVNFLLDHWVTREPLGPCHYGIGTLFFQIAYPFSTYNLFYYVYVLSFYPSARKDKRFLDAFSILQSKTKDGQIIVERPNQKLAGFTFCQKGKPSELATKRYNEIRTNLGL